MNVKKFVLYLIVVFAISVFLVSCAVKTIGKPSVTSSPYPTATPTPTPTPTATPSPPSSPPPSPTPEECKTDDDCHDDGWYDTDPLQTQWVNTETGNTIADQCTKKEQKKQEYRDYSCNPNSKCEYSIDTSKGDNGYNWIDIGNTRCKPYGTGCVLPASTSPTPSPTVSASPSSSPTLSSSPTSSPSTSSSPSSSPTPTIEGFCKDCSCIPKNCENIYGSDYQPCPAGSSGGTKCCKESDECCWDKKTEESAKNAVCCPAPKTKWKCYSANVAGYSINSCNEKCEEPTPQTCTDLGFVKCCPSKEDGYYCGKNWGPICVKKECDTSKGEFVCTTNWFKKLCCQKNEVCIAKPVLGGVSTKYACYPKYCFEGYYLCRGRPESEFTDATLCCKEGEICTAQPSGYPRCVGRISASSTSSS